MRTLLLVGVIAFALYACRGEPQSEAVANNSASPVLPEPSAPPAVANSVAPAKPTASLAEPKGPIDPKSVEAAGQVVQQYGALIEQHRLDEAAKLWGDAASAAAFAKQLQSDVHLEIGELGEMEGAAGSSYTTMPVVFYGKNYRKSAEIILRRVNDVPGSTEAQRRWHIERIEWKGAA